jgi:hypothetical protein
MNVYNRLQCERINRVSSLNIIVALISVAIVFGASAAAGSGSSWASKTNVTDRDIELLVANSDLVVVAKVVSCEYQCPDVGGGLMMSVAMVEVEIESTLYGNVEAGKILLQANKVSSYDCEYFMDTRGPKPIEVGERYVFFCQKRYDSGDKREVYKTHDSTIFCLGDDGNLTTCNGPSRFESADPLSVLNKLLNDVDYAELADEADVVAYVSGLRFKNKAKSEAKRNVMDLASIQCDVVKVLKGDMGETRLEFSAFASPDFSESSFRPAAVDLNRSALVFLRRTSDGYSLIKGNKGYYLIENGKIFNDANVYLGKTFDGQIISSEER